MRTSWPTWPRRWRRPPRPEPVPAGAIDLGTGRTGALGVGPKAALLDRAAAAGLPVPAGFVVPDGETAPEDVTAWAAAVDADAVAVRSAFGAEDDQRTSLAGWFVTELGVAPDQVAAAAGRVRDSADLRDGSFRRDVLVMAMVPAEHAGVVFSEPGTYDDLVNVTTGLGDKLVGGEEAGERLELPRIEPAPRGWRRRLQRLVGAVRAELGDEAWDIEWADDGATCWLLQVRAITAPPRRDETLTLANHAEILPALPSQLMASVIERAGPDLFGWYRRRVPGLPGDREFLHVVYGRPMINLSLLEDMLRHLGLPTGLVAGSIGGSSAASRPARPRRMLRSAPALLRLGASQVAAVVASARRRRRLAAIGRAPAQSFAAALDDLHRAYVGLVSGMFPLSSAIGPPLAVLRSTGTLLEHAVRHQTVTTELAERLHRLRAAVAAEGPSDERVRTELEAFLADFGHRGVYESDIARPRYRDEPDQLVVPPGAAVRPAETAATTAPRTWRGVLTWPLWLLAARPLSAREWLRHDAMRSFAAVRDALVVHAGRATARGQLRSPDDLWLLTVDEVRALDDGWRPTGEFWAEREDERARLAAIDVPPVVRRFEDPTDWADPTPASTSALLGLPLTTGTVEGVAWVLDEPSTTLPDGFARDRTVLVARSLDAGWAATLEQVAAVVVEIGGDLSHGSILVRELGTPAITNVHGVTRRIHTGDVVRVRAGPGTVDVLAPAG